MKPKTLTPVPLLAEVSGRIRNIGKPKSWYMAVAEAIKNALDSIEESGSPGNIVVEIIRRADLFGSVAPVENVVVSDTGVGFTESHFISFSTPDSLQKY